MTNADIGSEVMERSARQPWPYAIAAVTAAVLLLVGGRYVGIAGIYAMLIASILATAVIVVVVLTASWGLIRGGRRDELLNQAWMAAVVISFAAGIAFWLGHPDNLGFLPAPKGMGYYIAIASFAGGLAFGLRGAVLGLAGLAAYGLTGFIGDTISPPSGDDQRALYLLFVTIIPAVFMVPALTGAFLHRYLSRR